MMRLPLLLACLLIGLASAQIIKPKPTWPRGAYGLTKPDSGCPTASSGFTWGEGVRFHDTEDVFPSNKWSIPLNFYGYYGKNDMEQHFCMKNDAEVGETDWPPGQYCLFKSPYHDCPAGFQPGWIYWDEADINNRNEVAGDVPDGVYDDNTLIRYCCRTDGFASNPIDLPKDASFFLLRHTHQCQEVNGMNAMEQWFEWDTADWFTNNDYEGIVPDSEIGKNIRIQYCYYWKLSIPIG